MKNKVEIIVEKQIKSTNKLLCRRCSCRLGSEKNEWEKQIRASIVNLIKFKNKVCISIYSYRSKSIDHDNAYVSIKAIIDSLKEGRIGLIQDDSPKFIEGPYFYQFIVKDKKRQRTEIVMHEIE